MDILEASDTVPEITLRLDRITKVLMQILTVLKVNQRPEDLPEWVNLPDHLRKTFVTVMQHGELTADDVSEHTKRHRAPESGYLNTLVTMGYLTKERRGRKTFFSLHPSKKQNDQYVQDLALEQQWVRLEDIENIL